MKKQQGFTLIELVVVIVILGILAATALPKFINLSSDARDAALQGVAGALSSASAVNYGGRSVSSVYGVPITNCNTVQNALAGGMPSGYTASGGAIAAGSSVSCTLTPTTAGNLATTTFVGIGIL